MTQLDLRGQATGTASSAARDSVERALWHLMSFYDSPLPALEAAIAADDGWALPHVMKAAVLLGTGDAAQLPAAARHLAAAQTRLAQAPPRERAHAHAMQQALDGRLQAACRTWDELLVQHPLDALALQYAHWADYRRGDAQAMRVRAASVLPQWDAGDPLYGYVLALYAFGLEECNLYPQAEDVARRALQCNPRVPWAVHAVAHVLEMQGRFDEGGAWLRQHQSAWAEGNGIACHLWWHKALFRLEALDVTGVLRLIDKYLSGEALQTVPQRLDATSLLWRLHLMGHDVSAAFAEVLQRWAPPPEQAGLAAFIDAHVVMACLGAGEVARAEAWVARCAGRALDAGEAGRQNHHVARDTGLPLMRALLALARGDADSAAPALYAMRAQAHRLGGSHVQRDVIDQTLLAAAARASAGVRETLGRAVLNERLLSKPATPLTRYWAEELQSGGPARA